MSDETDTLARPGTSLDASTLGLRLQVTEGPSAGAEVVLEPSSPMGTLVGTSESCALRLADPTVSRRHVLLEHDGTSFRVRDLGSRNGTRLDGVPILEALLRPGALLQIGASSLRVHGVTLAAEAPRNALRFGRVIGASPAMRRLHPLCERLAPSRLPLLVEGERGTGKELLAEALHATSGRTGPWLVLDPAGTSAEALARELFGEGEVPGLLERAAQGTVFVDDVDELPLEVQSTLARTLARGAVRRVGSDEARPFDARLVVATRRDLDELVQSGRFAEALLAQLTVARIALPPLRSRTGDVSLLARHFAEVAGGELDEAVLASFEGYAWPGNVTELRSAVLRRMVLGDLDEPFAQAADETPAPGGHADGEGGDFLDRLASSGLAFSVARRRAIEEFERRYVAALLEANGGNVSRAAARAGIALRYFQRVKSKHRAGGSADE